MPLIAELIEIPESVQRDDFVLKLTSGVSDEAAVKTLSSYVVTPELAGKFDEALGFLKAAVETGLSKATFLHGSFGSGKSHFMAVLHRIMQGDPAARGLRKLAGVIPKHAAWLGNRKFLLVPYYMIGKKDVASAILGGYVDTIRERHPESQLPGVYLGATLFEDAKRLRQQFGDEAFFTSLNREDAGGWGKMEKKWDAASFEAAIAAAPGSDQRSQLIAALMRTFFTSYGTQADGKNEAFLELDKGLQVISRHAKSLGYDAVVLFLDELVLWLAGQASNPDFVHLEVQKLVNLVESQESRRDIPIVSFVARQRDLVDLLGSSTPGAQQLRFSDAVKHWEERFGKITLEDRNLPAIAEERILKPRSDAARAQLDTAFRQALPSRDEVRRILQTTDYDEQQFRQVYPFTPALVSALVAVSSVLQRDRTAIRLLMQLLVEQRETLEVGDLVPVGDLFDLIADGAQGFSPEMARHFENAARLYNQKLLPALEAKHGRLEQLQSLPFRDPKRTAFRNDDRLLKTLLLAALVPGEKTLKGLTASRLAALNHGTIRSPIPGQEPQEVLRRCREWAGTIGEIRIGGEQDPSIAIQLSAVDTDSILAEARAADTFGERVRRVRRIVYDRAGVEGEDLLEQRLSLNWKGTPRQASILFKNIRELPASSLENAGEDWRLILDYPFDEPGHSPQEDLDKLTVFQSTHGDGARTICWVPSFLGTRAVEELGLLVRCEHVLGRNIPNATATARDERFRECTRQLTEQDRQSARIILENQQAQLEARVRTHVAAAYGLSEEHSGSLAEAQTIAPADQFVSLKAQLGLTRPAAVTFSDALANLLSQALAFEYPAAPHFGVEVKISNMKKVGEKILETLDEPGRRVFVEPALRPLIRGIANPLKLGILGEDRDHFVLGDHWETHFTQKIAQEVPSEIRVSHLRRWIDDPKPMGLPSEAANLVILVYARQTNQTFSRHGGPYSFDIQSLGTLADDVSLRAETLPTPEAWQAAGAVMKSALGITPPETMTVRAIDRTTKDAKARVGQFLTSIKEYDANLANTLGRLSVPLPSSQRMDSLRAGRRLADEIMSKTGTELVNAVADMHLPTSADAIGIAIAQSAKLKSAIDAISWPLLDTVKAIQGPLQQEAAAVLGILTTAASADEHAAPLKTAIDAFNRDAAALVARAMPSTSSTGTLPPVPKPATGKPGQPVPLPPAQASVGRRIVKQDSRQNLDPASAKRLLEEIERDASGPRKASVQITWTIDEPESPA